MRSKLALRAGELALEPLDSRVADNEFRAGVDELCSQIVWRRLGSRAAIGPLRGPPRDVELEPHLGPCLLERSPEQAACERMRLRIELGRAHDDAQGCPVRPRRLWLARTRIGRRVGQPSATVRSAMNSSSCSVTPTKAKLRWRCSLACSRASAGNGSNGDRRLTIILGWGLRPARHSFGARSNFGPSRGELRVDREPARSAAAEVVLHTDDVVLVPQRQISRRPRTACTVRDSGPRFEPRRPA
jgi:hypothetical protein